MKRKCYCFLKIFVIYYTKCMSNTYTKLLGISFVNRRVSIFWINSISFITNTSKCMLTLTFINDVLCECISGTFLKLWYVVYTIGTHQEMNKIYMCKYATAYPFSIYKRAAATPFMHIHTWIIITLQRMRPPFTPSAAA